jgi:hypothetical protein
MTITPTSAEPTLGIFQPAVSKKYEPSSIAFFAASMFWRAAVHDWGQPDLYPIRIGDKYREQLRKFLLGQAPFPGDATLLTCLRLISPVNTLTGYPCSIEEPRLVHVFFVCGFFFSLLLGSHMTEGSKNLCIMNGERHPIVITSELEQDLVAYSKGMTGYKASQ